MKNKVSKENKVSYIGCDMHKNYSVFATIDEKGNIGPFQKRSNDKESIGEYLNSLPKGIPIAVESTGNWYWLIDQMEQVGLKPMLTHPRKAKLMMGQINKTDKLDAKGLATLLRNGTLPTLWIPPGELRDQRELLRWRMVVSQTGVRLKNRVHASFAKYGIKLEGATDLFGNKGKDILQRMIGQLPCETAWCVQQQLTLLRQIEIQLKQLEHRIMQLIGKSDQMRLIQTAPGIGNILSIVIMMELGDITRFYKPEKLAAYCGLVPRVHSSGGKTFYGRIRRDVNLYLKWAFTEAANSVSRHRRKWPDKHAVRLYERIRRAKGHSKAIIAVGRHLAEAVYCMVSKDESYREPKKHRNVSSTPGQAREKYAVSY